MPPLTGGISHGIINIRVDQISLARQLLPGRPIPLWHLLAVLRLAWPFLSHGCFRRKEAEKAIFHLVTLLPDDGPLPCGCWHICATPELAMRRAWRGAKTNS